MRKGLKKFTVPYSGTYFDGGRIYGQRVIYAENAEAAENKLQKIFEAVDDEPIRYAGTAQKWQFGDKNERKVYPYWGMDV